MTEEKRIVEINGVKLEVDLRTAKTIDHYKVGTSIKVLKKEYSDYKSYPGVIIGFDEFKELPTIIVAYLKVEYSSADLCFAYINAQSKDIEICPANDKEIPYEKYRVLELLDRAITEKEQNLIDLKNKKTYFLHSFDMYFTKQQPQ